MAKKRYSHKQIRKSIKKDELRDLIDKSIDYVRNHTENILISAVIVVVIIVLIPLYFNNRSENERRAASLFNQAVGYSMQPIAEGMTDPNSMAFHTLEEKYKKVQQSFAEISATYKNTRAAAMAKMGEADAVYYLKDYEKAQTLYQDILMNSKDQTEQGTVKEKIAACLENMGKWQDAFNIYQALATEDSYFNQRSIQLGMARCYSALGKQAEAKEIYRAQQAEEPGSYWSEVARQCLLHVTAGEK